MSIEKPYKRKHIKIENIQDKFNRDIMIAVDESEDSLKAVSYVARLLGGLCGFRVMLMHIIDEPGEDYFDTPEDHEKWLCHYKKRLKKALEGYRQELVLKGFDPDSVSTLFIHMEYPSIVKYILSECDKRDCCTIVVGRHWITRSEEFMFGSISNIMAHPARNCAVCIVE
jgi:nucleotide-binding universal stress UspA family protein